VALIACHKEPDGKGNVIGSWRPSWVIHVIQPNGGRTEQSCLTSFSSVQLRFRSVSRNRSHDLGAYQAHLHLSDKQREALAKQGHNEQRYTDQ
jgi:hypothetical protein